MKYLIASLDLLYSGISSSSEEILFHDGGNNNTYVVEIIASKNIGEEKGLETIANAATKKCGDKPPHLGKYRFESQ